MKGETVVTSLELTLYSHSLEETGEGQTDKRVCGARSLLGPHSLGDLGGVRHSPSPGLNFPFCQVRGIDKMISLELKGSQRVCGGSLNTDEPSTTHQSLRTCLLVGLKPRVVCAGNFWC